MPNWIWPNGHIVQYGFGARLGRVVHWLFTFLFALCLITALLTGAAAWRPGSDAVNVYATAYGILGLGVILYFVGRIGRYLFGGE